jgi:hypothetical protein
MVNGKADLAFGAGNVSIHCWNIIINMASLHCSSHMVESHALLLHRARVIARA